MVLERIAAGGVPVGGAAGQRRAGVAVAVVFGQVGVGERRDIGPGPGAGLSFAIGGRAGSGRPACGRPGFG